MSDATTLTLRGRIMYPHVHHPHAFADDVAKGKEPKYRASLVIPQNDPQIAKIVELTRMIAKEDLGVENVDFIGKPLKVDPDNPKLAGMYVLKATTKYKPSVLTLQMEPIMDPAVPADGDHVYMNVNLFSFDNAGNRGVSASLNGIMWIEKGEQLGKSGRPSDQTMFGAVAQTGQSGGALPEPVAGSVPNPFGPR